MLIKSTQSKAILGAGVLSIIITQFFSGFAPVSLITSLVSYIGLAYNANCLVSGGCGIWAWITLCVPLFATIGYIVATLRGDETAQQPQTFGAVRDLSGKAGELGLPTLDLS